MGRHGKELTTEQKRYQGIPRHQRLCQQSVQFRRSWRWNTFSFQMFYIWTRQERIDQYILLSSKFLINFKHFSQGRWFDIPWVGGSIYHEFGGVQTKYHRQVVRYTIDRDFRYIMERISYFWIDDDDIQNTINSKRTIINWTKNEPLYLTVWRHRLSPLNL
jgi:hypothetical protein